MKNRRIALVAFLIAAVLCISVGYAAVTDILDIQGAANVDAANVNTAFDENIYFSAAAVGDAAGIKQDNQTADTATVSATPDKATFSANGLTVKGDKAYFTFTIQNDNLYSATVTPELSANTKADYFKVTSDWNTTAQTIDAQSSKTITVSVELIKAVTESVGTSISIELDAAGNDPNAAP